MGLLSLGSAWAQGAAPAAPRTAPEQTAQPADRRHTTTLAALALARQPACRLVAPQHLRCDDQLRLANLQGLDVDGQDLQVEFTRLEPGRGGLYLPGAKDVRLRHFRVSWAGGSVSGPAAPSGQRIQTLGRVLACAAQDGAGGALQLDQPLDGEHPVRAVSGWDDETGWPWKPNAAAALDLYLPKDTRPRWVAGRSSCLPQLGAQVGQRVLVRHVVGGSHAIACVACEGVRIEDVWVQSGPSMAFVFELGGKDLVLQGNRVAPACWPDCKRPEPSVAADASHFSGTQGPITVQGNDFGWQGDDSVNITGMLLPVQQVAPLPAPTASRRQSTSAPVWVACPPEMRWRLPLFQAGMAVQVYDQGLNLLGVTRIAAVDATTHRLQLAHWPAPGTEAVLASIERSPGRVQVLGNYFHDHRARGILMGGADSVIEFNRIERVTMAAIMLPADTHRWFEGPGPRRVRIRFNQIEDVNHMSLHQSLYFAAISAGVDPHPSFKGSLGTPIDDVELAFNRIQRVHHRPETLVNFGAGSRREVR